MSLAILVFALLQTSSAQTTLIISTVVTGLVNPFQLGPDGTGGGFLIADAGAGMVIRAFGNGSRYTVISGLASAWGGATTDGAGGLYSDNGNNRIFRQNASGARWAVAGNGTVGYAGNGGPGTLAMLRLPYGLGSDGAGGVYIGDTFNHAVRRLFSNGTLINVAGTGVAGFSGDRGPGTQAKMNLPEASSLDASGALLVAEVCLFKRVVRYTHCNLCGLVQSCHFFCFCRLAAM